MTEAALPRKLDELLANGLTYKVIAKKAGCNTSTIFRIRTGCIADPSYSVGSAIDEMYADLKSKPIQTTAA